MVKVYLKWCMAPIHCNPYMKFDVDLDTSIK